MPRRRSPARALEAHFHHAPRPAILFDGERRIIFANPSLLAWLGIEELEPLLGLTLPYAVPEQGPLADCDLAPPPTCFEGIAAQVICRCARSGEPRRRRGACLPLGGTPSAVLLLLEPRDLSETPVVEEESPEELHRRLAELCGGGARPRRPVGMSGCSFAIGQAWAQAEAAMRSGGRVVIVGPPGSGREELARAIHRGGKPENSPGPLAPLDCSLLDAERLQATVMAFLRRLDSLENSRGGLLLLEVDSLEANAQHELSGLLQLPGLHLRTLATAQAPLADLAARGNFRADLAAQLEIIRIVLPPLRERLEDLPLLAQAIVEQANAAGGRQRTGFTPEALDRLVLYEWPGNVGQFRSVVEAACRQAEGSQVEAGDLPPLLTHAAGEVATAAEEPAEIDLDSFLASVERELAARALERAAGNKSRAARALGISRPRLLRLLSPADSPQSREENSTDDSEIAAEDRAPRE